MTLIHTIKTLAAMALLATACAAQAQSSNSSAFSGMGSPNPTINYDGDGWFARPSANNTGRSYLPFTSQGYAGISAGRSDYSVSCAGNPYCNTHATAFKVYTGGQLFRVAGLELAYVNAGSISATRGSARAQGLNLSAVANLPIYAFNTFAKVGTTYGWTRNSIGRVAGRSSSDDGFGLSYGAGLQYNLTEVLALRAEWDQMHFKFARGREAVDMYTAGLVFRFN